MSGRKRFLLLFGILTAVAIGAGTISLKVLYDTAFEEERERLVETAESQAMLLYADGCWLAAPNSEDEWGFIFGIGDLAGDSWNAVSARRLTV